MNIRIIYLLCIFLPLKLSSQVTFTRTEVIKIANTVDSLQKESEHLFMLNSINEDLIVKLKEKDSLSIIKIDQLTLQIKNLEHLSTLQNNTLQQYARTLDKKNKWWNNPKFWFGGGLIMGIILPKIL